MSENPPEGIKVYINEEDLTDIQATIEGPGEIRMEFCTKAFLCIVPLSRIVAGTPYEGGMFKMKLVLGKDFPAAPPQGKLIEGGQVTHCLSTLDMVS